MTRSVFLSLFLGAILALVGCSTPPITTPSVTSTVYLRDIVPGMPETPTPTLVPAAGPFNLPPAAIDVPPNARSVTLTSATLNMDFKNQMKVPLGLKIYLSNAQNAVYDDFRHLVLIQIPSPITDAKIGKVFHGLPGSIR